MASFQAKIGWKRWRKGENKNCHSVPFVLDGKYKIPKKEKKNNKIPLWLHFMTKQVGKCREREKIKIVFRFPYDRTGNRKFQKKRRKFKKIKKYICGFISSQNRMEKAQRAKRKIIVSFRSELTCYRKFKKNSKKIQ